MKYELLHLPNALSAMIWAKEEMLGLVMPGEKRDVVFFGSEGREDLKGLDFPPMLFLMNLSNGIHQYSLLVLRDDGMVAPFTGGNVYEEHAGMCWGRLPYPKSPLEAWCNFWYSSFNSDLVRIPEENWNKAAFYRHLEEVASSIGQRIATRGWLRFRRTSAWMSEPPLNPTNPLGTRIGRLILLVNKKLSRYKARRRYILQERDELVAAFDRFFYSFATDFLLQHSTGALEEEKITRLINRQEDRIAKLIRLSSADVYDISALQRFWESVYSSWFSSTGYANRERSGTLSGILDHCLEAVTEESILCWERGMRESPEEFKACNYYWRQFYRTRLACSGEYTVRAFEAWAQETRHEYLVGWLSEGKWKNALNFRPLEEVVCAIKNITAAREPEFFDMVPSYVVRHLHDTKPDPRAEGLYQIQRAATNAELALPGTRLYCRNCCFSEPLIRWEYVADEQPDRLLRCSHCGGTSAEGDLLNSGNKERLISGVSVVWEDKDTLLCVDFRNKRTFVGKRRADGPYIWGEGHKIEKEEEENQTDERLELTEAQEQEINDIFQ